MVGSSVAFSENSLFSRGSIIFSEASSFLREKDLVIENSRI